MSDVEEIIDYMKHLKKGFDKDLFQNKIDELAGVVDTTGFYYEDFHTLFKVWLNLSIPITKWINVGTCLVPRDCIEERTVDYVLRWLLANYNQNQSTCYSRIGFVLDWLTVAMDYEAIDMNALQSGYEIFYTMLTYEVLTPHAIKLVYKLTKPHDVTRRRVIELLDCAKKVENKKSMHRQLQVLLGLFKLYKPEYVPENIPAISVNTAFKKLNVSLVDRFNKNQGKRNSLTEQKHHLQWNNNSFGSKLGINKKVEPLIPNLETLNMGSQQYAEQGSQKNHLDFTDASSLVWSAARGRVRRPARLRALLRSDVGLTLLAAAHPHDHVFLSHDLLHVLNACFLNPSPHSIPEKCDFLHRLALLQRTLMQGIPVVTHFLAQFLPLWNEKDYFAEILELVEWLSVDCHENVACIVDVLRRVCCRAQPLEQCAILRALTNMYTNLIYTSTRRRLYFMDMKFSENTFNMIFPHISASISDMCENILQINPKDMRLLYSSLRSAEQRARCELKWSIPLGATARPLTLALPLLTASAALLDKAAAVLLLCKQIMRKTTNEYKDDDYRKQIYLLRLFTKDMLNSLVDEHILINREVGFVFSNLSPQLVEEINSLVPDANSALSVRYNLAFAPYTYMQQEAMVMDDSPSDNKLWFDAVIDQEFINLSKLLKKLIVN